MWGRPVFPITIDSGRPGTKVLPFEHTSIKLSYALWSEYFLCVKGLISPTHREATRVKETLPLAHLAAISAQHIRFNPGSAQARQKCMLPSQARVFQQAQARAVPYFMLFNKLFKAFRGASSFDLPLYEC